MSALYRTKERLNLQQPPEVHHPIYTSIFTYLKLDVQLDYFPIPAVTGFKPCDTILPCGSRNYRILCYLDYSQGLDKRVYQCKIMHAEAQYVNPKHSIVTDQNVVFEVQLFDNQKDLLHIKRTEGIYYLDFRVGMLLPSPNHEKYRLYWRAFVTEDASHI
jgi:hypothetical protein